MCYTISVHTTGGSSRSIAAIAASASIRNDQMRSNDTAANNGDTIQSGISSMAYRPSSFNDVRSNRSTGNISRESREVSNNDSYIFICVTACITDYSVHTAWHCIVLHADRITSAHIVAYLYKQSCFGSQVQVLESYTSNECSVYHS
jgi:hypothetical protein